MRTAVQSIKTVTAYTILCSRVHSQWIRGRSLYIFVGHWLHAQYTWIVHILFNPLTAGAAYIPVFIFY